MLLIVKIIANRYQVSYVTILINLILAVNMADVNKFMDLIFVDRKFKISFVTQKNNLKIYRKLLTLKNLPIYILKFRNDNLFLLFLNYNHF
jgi:hypothetical protein